MLYFKKEGILAVGTIRGNRIQGCPLVGNKDIEKGNHGDLDYWVDNNSGAIIVKWLDNNVVQLFQILWVFVQWRQLNDG